MPKETFSCGAPTVLKAIIAAHTAPEWCVFSEVADATSGRCSRRADALAMNMWQSRGLEFRGFEIKVSRSDLKRELEDPSKADSVGKFCDTWSLAYPAGLVRPDDNIPTNWGLFEVGANGGRFARLPTTRPREEVTPVTRVFTAAIARAAHAELAEIHKGVEWVRRDDIQAEMDKEFKRGVESAPDEHAHKMRELETKADQLKEILEILQVEKYGSFSEWNKKVDMGDTIQALRLGVALVSRWGNTFPEKAVKSMKDSISLLTEAVKKIGPLIEEKKRNT